MPRRALQERMHGLWAIKRRHLLRAGLISEFAPPLLESLDHFTAVTSDFLACRVSAIGRRHVGVLNCVVHAFRHGFEKRLPNSKHMMAEQANGTIAIGNNA